MTNSNFPTDEIYESETEARKHLKTQRNAFEQYAKNILNFIPIQNGQLLDIGCGFGWVVKEAENRGFKAYGVDQSKTYTNLGKKTLGVDLKNVSLEKFKSDKRFDVITINHVLEHIKKPTPFLNKVHKLIKSDGTVFVAVPNIDSLMSKIFRNRWYGLQPNQHIWQFTPSLLQKVLSENKFQVVKLETRNLDYQVNGLKGLIFKVILFIAPKINQGDQIFLLCKPL